MWGTAPDCHCERSEAIQEYCFTQRRKGAKKVPETFAPLRESKLFFWIASSLRSSQ
jgi:hypothetical protein